MVMRRAAPFSKHFKRASFTFKVLFSFQCAILAQKKEEPGVGSAGGNSLRDNVQKENEKLASEAREEQVISQ